MRKCVLEENKPVQCQHFAPCSSPRVSMWKSSNSHDLPDGQHMYWGPASALRVSQASWRPHTLMRSTVQTQEGLAAQERRETVGAALVSDWGSVMRLHSQAVNDLTAKNINNELQDLMCHSGSLGLNMPFWTTPLYITSCPWLLLKGTVGNVGTRSVYQREIRKAGWLQHIETIQGCEDTLMSWWWSTKNSSFFFVSWICCVRVF